MFNATFCTLFFFFAGLLLSGIPAAGTAWLHSTAQHGYTSSKNYLSQQMWDPYPSNIISNFRGKMKLPGAKTS